MKIKNLIPTILLIAVFMPGNSIFISCKPSNEIVPDTIPSNLIYYDTIKPKDYLPVYPGSWWKYQINDKEFIIDAGNTGGAFGIPTFIAGPPRFIGFQTSVNF